MNYQVVIFYTLRKIPGGINRGFESLTLRRSLYDNQNQQFTKVDC